VWVYDRTGSLPIAMLMHASLSACTFALGPEKVTGLALLAYGFTLAVVWWTVVAVVAAIGSGRLSARPGKTPPFRTPNGELISGGISRSPTFGLAGSIEMVPND